MDERASRSGGGAAMSSELVEPSGQRKAVALAPVINSAAEANQAHRRIVGSVQDAIEIGEFLTMKKQSLPHGKWLPWLKANIEFAQNTAWRYMNLAANRGKLSRVDDLDAAYKLLSEKAPEDKPKPNPKPEPKKQDPTSWSAFENQEQEQVLEVELTMVQPIEEGGDDDGHDPMGESNRLIGGEVDEFLNRVERIISQNRELKDYLVWNVKQRLESLFKDSGYKIILQSRKSRQEEQEVAL
jgi:hypothetical protein